MFNEVRASGGGRFCSFENSPCEIRGDPQSKVGELSIVANNRGSNSIGWLASC